MCEADGSPLVVEAEVAPPATTARSRSPLGEQRLGRYRLIRIIGEGGMARIYLAEEETRGRLCAIKRLHATHFSDRVTVGRFLREARAVAGIDHPNLVATYDVIDQPDEICLVMEYLDGCDLAEVLEEEGPLDPLRAAAYCAQACDGLEAVHTRGIIHRDLKPENLFLAYEPNGEERIKLLDFGVARLLEELPRDLRTKTGQTVGTPMYMSPEQATASEDLDGRSDIYMLGVVLFELLTGTRPFCGAGYGEVMLKHVNDPPPRPTSRRRSIPPWLEDIVMRCLEKDPDARYQSAAKLASALRGHGTGRELPAAERVAAGGEERHRRSDASLEAKTARAPVFPVADEPAVGDLLGGYQLEDMAGEGAMGRVFRARRLSDGRTVALKLLRRKYAARAEAIGRFFAEARAITVIRHPHIVEILDCFDGGPKMPSYFVMEWLTGMSLAAYLARRGALGGRETARIGSQVASALAVVHEEGFVHRDIKPDNIFLVDPERLAQVKLLDFGVAVLEGTGEGGVVGSPTYFSPECAAGHLVDVRSDIYSLGVVLYELLAGCPPFMGNSLAECAMKHMTARPPPLGEATAALVPQRLAHVIHRCLAKDPAARIQSMKSLERELADIESKGDRRLRWWWPW